MKANELIAAGVPLQGTDELTALKAEAAIDWMAEHTTLNIDKRNIATIENLPAAAKVFVCKYIDALNMKTGVASQSIEGLSLSFSTTDQAGLIWSLANALLSPYLRSQVKVFPAKRRW